MAPRKVKPPVARSLSDQAYWDLEALIVSLQLAPGAVVTEPDLSRLLGIGRTPIREALQRLAREGLVSILPRKGIMVTEISVTRQLRLLELRRVLEPMIARTAARRATEAERQQIAAFADVFEAYGTKPDDDAFMQADRGFHSLVSEACRNVYAQGAMTLIQSLSRRFFFAHRETVGDRGLIARMHAKMARAIVSKDEERAAAATLELLDVIEKFTRAAADA